MMLTKKRLFLNFFLIVSVTLTVSAEEALSVIDETILFEDIPSVYSASKYEQPVTKAPSSVSIVTADDIKKFGYRNLADVLSSMKGMYTSYDRAYHRVGTRGFNRPGDYNYRLLVLVDGHRTNDNLVDYSAVGSEFLIDVDDISRVELVRGPSSSLYGSNAFFGIVNVITKRGRDIQSAGITGLAGSQDSYKGKFSYGDKFAKGAEVYLSASHFQSEGEDYLDVSGLGAALDMDREHSQRGFAKGSFADFTLSGGYVVRDKRLPVPIAGVTFNDKRSDFIDSHAYVDLLYEHAFDNGLDVMARGYYDVIEFDGSYGFVPESLYQDKFIGQWWGSELKLGQKLGAHYLTLGGEYRHNFQQDMRSFDTPPYFEYANVNQNTAIWGIYFQDEYRILDNLTLNAGVRYDQYDFVGGSFNPRVALIYEPFDDTTLKLLYGEAFRAPSIFEHNYTFADTWIQSADLEAEKMRSYEVNLAQRLNKNIAVSLSPYYYEVSGIIELTGEGTPESPHSYQNLSNISTYGFEAEVSGHWENGWRSSLSYSYQQSSVENQERYPENSPVHLTKLNMVAPLWQDRVFAGLNVNYTSRRNTFASHVSGYLLANLTLYTTNFIKGLEVSGSVYNLLGVTYDDPSTTDLAAGSIEQNGRLFMAKFSYEF